MSAATSLTPARAAPADAPRAARAGVLPVVCGLLLLSGGAGLVYQVVWVRLLGLAFGVSVYAVSTVLAAFMGGLAIGSLIGGRQADRVKRPLRVYGLVELAVGATAMLTPAAFTWLQELYRGLALVVDPTQAPLIAGLVRGVLAFALLLVPTGLMGATLPLAVRGVRRAADVAGDSRAMGALYALNTTGAILGTWSAGFLLIGEFGLRSSIAVAALANLAAGLGAMAVSVATNEGRPAASPAPAAPPSVTPSSVSVGPLDRALNARLARAAFWAFAVSGLISLAYEVIWSRVLAILFDSTIYGFVLMLATVLAGIALGSAASGILVSRFPGTRFVGQLFGWVEVGIGLAAVLALASFGWAYQWLAELREIGGPLFGRLLRTDARLMAVLCIITIFPTSFLMGATFPPAARLWAAGEDQLGRRLGGVYAGNVVGGILGSLAAGFLLLPLVGSHLGLLLLAVGNVLLGVWLLSASRQMLRRSPSRWREGQEVGGTTQSGCFPPAQPVGHGAAVSGKHSGPLGSGRPAAAVAALALGLVVVGWGATRPPVHEQVFRERFGDQQLLWYREGLENTVSVAQDASTNIRRLYTNSLSQTNDSPDLVRYHTVMGHLAALISPSNQRVLVVGLGGGATPGAIARYAGTRLQVVELSEAVVAAAPSFRHINGDLLARPNVSLTIDDGRNFLLRSRQPYDIITADIVPPSHAGATNLYSVEYFRLVARSLAPGGIMVQWVSPESAFTHQVITRTFLAAFPYATLWLGGDLLIGSNEPLRISEARLRERLADPAARASLAEVGLNKPEDVLYQFRGDTDELRAYVGPGPILSDDRPLLEYFYSLDAPPSPPDLSQFSGDASKVLDGFRQ